MSERKIIKGWRYYNHAAVPTCAPHKKADLKPVRDGSIWNIEGARPFLARWTEDFDCKDKTEWWYCVLDKPFDISVLKSNRRYKINKGNRLFDVRQIEPMEYADELKRVQIAAFSAYPAKYRPVVDDKRFYKYLQYYSEDQKKEHSLFYGAFFKETGKLCGYHIVTLGDGFRGCNVLKSDPDYEKYQINAALVYKWVKDAEKFIEDGGYLVNGSRTINHETAFQDYLEYYFGFRKAYCILRLVYHPLLRLPVKILYLFRGVLNKLDNNGFVHNVNAVLKMENIARGCRR